MKNVLYWILALATIASASSGPEPPPCNPNTDKKCFARDAALATSIFEPFTSSSKRFRPLADSPGISYCDNGAKLTMTKRFDNPSIVSNFYILYGKVEVEIKAAAGTGIISSFYLQSDDLDEIDVAEVFGGDIYEFQTNFFVKGNTTTYDRGGYHPMPVPPMQEFNKYGIEWTPQKLIWTLNGVPVRTLTNDTPHGFPNSPMDIKFSLWAGGDPDNEQGTIDWAGGITQYTQLPFSMYVKNMYAMDYSTGIEYNYGNSWDGKWIELRSNQGSIYGKMPSPTTSNPNPVSESELLGTDTVMSSISQESDDHPTTSILSFETGSEESSAITTPTAIISKGETAIGDGNDRFPSNKFIQYFNRSLDATSTSSQISNSLLKVVYVLVLESIFIVLWM
ncbi:hypothetical protein G9P44_000267 [Scheffersomyces stipitis]|nr:hypothetical protein G9P44_000267 [Scheffersomyces stipitis]